MKSAWSKAFYRKTEKWRNWINSSKHSIASIIFFLSPINRRFFRFSSDKEEKRQVLTNEEKHFLWRHSLLDPTSVTEVHIAFCHPLRHQFIGQHFLVNKISSKSQSSIDTQLEHFAFKIKFNLQLWSHQCQALLRKKKKIRQGLNTLTHRPSSKLAWT